MKKKALFIDRDGTLIREPADEQIDSFEKIEFYPGMFRWLSALVRDNDYELVMVTNQDGLGTEVFPEEDFWPVHNFVMKCLEKEAQRRYETVNALALDIQRHLRNEPVSAEELAKFVSYNVGRFGLSLETSESVLASLVDLEVHALPDDSLDTYRGRLRAVDLDTVHAVTRERLHPDRIAIVVLGPAEEIAPQLERFGEVEIWD